MKNNIQGKGYNKGDKYEDKITNILIDKGILPEDYKRAGASNRSDIEIIYKNPSTNNFQELWEITDKEKFAKYYGNCNFKNDSTYEKACKSITRLRECNKYDQCSWIE